jgi:hypothetical protein
MIIALVPIVLGAQLFVLADSVPTYNVEPVCQPIPELQMGDQDREVCLNSERVAREQLTKEWRDFPSDSKAQCIGLGQHFIQSYVELLVCLEMERDAKQIREQTTTPDEPKAAPRKRRPRQ